MRKKTYAKRTTYKRKARKKDNTFNMKHFLLMLFVVFFFFSFYCRNVTNYYFATDTRKKITDVRYQDLLGKNCRKAFGIDISEYQGVINWSKVHALYNGFPIQFVFIRATVGCDRLDKRFETNWSGAHRKKIISGAYHYYRPNENSLEQADLFIKTVHLRKGDLPPVLDIEKMPDNQSIERLKIGLKRWLEKVEAHYKVRPIIYSGEKYYTRFLKKEFSKYPFWIANYNFNREKIDSDWLFWQFSEKSTVSGIEGNVDANVFNGDLSQLKKKCVF